MVRIGLIAAGIMGLVHGRFSYTKQTHAAQIGSLELSVKDKETVNVRLRRARKGHRLSWARRKIGSLATVVD